MRKLLILLVLPIVVVACTSDRTTGPAGADGVQGPQGEKGNPGTCSKFVYDVVAAATAPQTIAAPEVTFSDIPIIEFYHLIDGGATYYNQVHTYKIQEGKIIVGLTPPGDSYRIVIVR